MATKAEQFRYEQERSGKKKAKQPPKRRRDWPVDTSLPGVSASDRKVGHGSTASRNLSQRAARNAAYVLEDSQTGRPSRKSTRKGANAMKPSHPLQLAKRTQRRRAARR